MSPKLNWEPPKTPTPIGEAWIDGGVLWHRLEPGITITNETTAETISTLASIVGDRRVPAVVDLRGVSFADSRSRARFANDVDFESATALVVDSKLGRALGNIYLRISKPNRPTRMFDSEDEAATWALSHADPGS